MNKTKKGFTLIELLIVISIIGILSALLLTNLFSVRERARDAKRKSDMNEIKNSLRLYYNDNQAYPTYNNSNYRIMGCGVTGTTECAWGASFQKDVNTIYMKYLPTDPSSGGGTDVYYRYWRNASDGDDFLLIGTLENDSDGEALKSQTRCSSYAIFPGTKNATDYVLCAD